MEMSSVHDCRMIDLDVRNTDLSIAHVLASAATARPEPAPTEGRHQPGDGIMRANIVGFQTNGAQRRLCTALVS